MGAAMNLSNGFLLADVAAASERIRAACPDVLLERSDYGFGLTAINPSGSVAVVFQPGRADNGQPEIIANVDDVIARMKVDR